MFPPTDSAKSGDDVFPTTDNVKDINPPRSLHVECVVFTIPDISFKFDYNDIYDINDLSNEIKRLDENKINQIYDYMNKQFQPLRGIFEDSIFYEKIDNGNLKFPSNYDAYINYLNKDMSKDDKAQTIKDIREFGKKLSSITPQNRDILFTCIENRINDDGWNINFLISDIRQRYTRNINDNIYSLMKHKFIELKEDSGNDYDVIAYNFEHSNILLDLLKYCEANNKNLKNILVNLDFSELE